jgi:multicomponent Na+:H+ antiporter subunit C
VSALLALCIGVLAGVAVLQILQRNVLRVAIGLYLLWNAANLLFIAVTRIRGDRAPVVPAAARDAVPDAAHAASAVAADGVMTDPLVQAFVLTAIIITFGFAAFLVALVMWLARHDDTVDVDVYCDARDAPAGRDA